MYKKTVDCTFNKVFLIVLVVWIVLAVGSVKTDGGLTVTNCSVAEKVEELERVSKV